MSESSQRREFSVSATSETPSRVRVEARDLEFVIDEPEAQGGTDEGPTPVEALLGAWAGCLNATVRAVAADVGVRVEGVDVDVAGEIDLATFLGDAEDERAGYEEIAAVVDVETADDIDEPTHEALLDGIEQRCPVGDNLAAPTPTSVTLQAD